jgi:hypothetical protein
VPTGSEMHPPLDRRLSVAPMMERTNPQANRGFQSFGHTHVTVPGRNDASPREARAALSGRGCVGMKAVPGDVGTGSRGRRSDDHVTGTPILYTRMVAGATVAVRPALMRYQVPGKLTDGRQCPLRRPTTARKQPGYVDPADQSAILLNGPFSRAGNAVPIATRDQWRIRLTT